MLKNVSAKNGRMNGLHFNSCTASNTLQFQYTTHRTLGLPTIEDRNSFEDCRETVNYVRVIKKTIEG